MIETVFEKAKYLILKNKTYSVVSNEVSYNNRKKDFIIVAREEKTRKTHIFERDFLEDRSVTYYRDENPNDIIRAYIEAPEEDNELNVKLSNKICLHIGIDQGMGDCILFADATHLDFEIAEDEYIIYDDGEYLILDGEDYGFELYLIVKKLV